MGLLRASQQQAFSRLTYVFEIILFAGLLLVVGDWVYKDKPPIMNANQLAILYTVLFVTLMSIECPLQVGRLTEALLGKMVIISWYVIITCFPGVGQILILCMCFISFMVTVELLSQAQHGLISKILYMAVFLFMLSVMFWVQVMNSTQLLWFLPGLTSQASGLTDWTRALAAGIFIFEMTSFIVLLMMFTLQSLLLLIQDDLFEKVEPDWLPWLSCQAKLREFLPGAALLVLALVLNHAFNLIAPLDFALIAISIVLGHSRLHSPAAIK